MAAHCRVLLAEDCTILRDGLRSILTLEDGFEVAGEAADGREAVRRAAELCPDLVLLDLTMPRTSGLDALPEIKAVCPAARVLVLTVHNEEEYVVAALRAGADGYLTKDSAAPELLGACRSVLAGLRYLSPRFAGVAVPEARRTKGAAAKRGGERVGLELLSGRERQVLTLVAEGRRTREIASYLYISPRTVDRHRSTLMKKLDLHTVSALTSYAIDHGLVGR